MDADYIEKQRDQLLSRREKRWSMNSQRLEEIVAELMKPISDIRRTFDTDLSALLEEYLTEAGLRALDGGEDADADAGAGVPNFMELALLLQQSANVYGRKVDYLYQHVLDVSESLQRATGAAGAAEAAGAGGAAGAGREASARRRRRASALRGGFELIALEAAPGGARREAARRPPPTLPRMYVELEPRALTPADVPLHDYAGEPIGLLADFQVTRRLHGGLLVDDLEDGTQSVESALRPLPLQQLQAAIDAASPPHSPLRASTPLPDRPDRSDPPSDLSDLPPDLSDPPPDSMDDTAPLPPPVGRQRKRRSAVHIDDIYGFSVKITIEEDVREKLSEVQEFSIPGRWIKRVVAKRKSHILSERRRLRALQPNATALSADFPGWPRKELDSDDDGFFEQSSDSTGAAGAAGAGGAGAGAGAAGAGAGAAWAARVAARAARARAPDVAALGARVRAQLAGGARSFGGVLRGAARRPHHVSHLLLATLFLANAGEVHIEADEPLAPHGFRLRLAHDQPAAEPQHEPHEQLHNHPQDDQRNNPHDQLHNGPHYDQHSELHNRPNDDQHSELHDDPQDDQLDEPHDQLHNEPHDDQHDDPHDQLHNGPHDDQHSELHDTAH